MFVANPGRAMGRIAVYPSLVFRLSNPGSAARAGLWFARVALAAGFVSAVSDRFGAWGPPGSRGVAWGTFANFARDVAALNPWAPEPLVPVLAWLVTMLEISAATLLLLPRVWRWGASLSAFLLLAFGVGMWVAAGLKAPLDYSVFAAAGAGLVLAALPRSRAVETPVRRPAARDHASGT